MKIYDFDMQESIRAVMVEHGSFYFGNWPQSAASEDPFDIEEPPRELAKFTRTGIGLFSDCGDEDDTARVRLYFYDGTPVEHAPRNSIVGGFEILGEELAVATLMMFPGELIASPYMGEVHARLYREPLAAVPTKIDRYGEICDVNEDWVVEIWPV